MALAIGTAHGIYAYEPKLDFYRLEEIREMLNIPLVLHGTSGVSEESIKKAVALGTCKINIATEIKMEFIKGVDESRSNYKDEYEPCLYLECAKEKVQKVVESKINLLGSAYKA